VFFSCCQVQTNIENALQCALTYVNIVRGRWSIVTWFYVDAVLIPRSFDHEKNAEMIKKIKLMT